MKALLGALLLLSSPAMGKTWVSETCDVSLVSNGDSFAYRVAGDTEYCKIASWPVASAAASMECRHGLRVTLSIVDDTAVLVDGQRLNAYDGRIPCGENGEEWPD